MPSVRVEWQVEIRKFPYGTKRAHHWHVGLGLQEQDVPIAQTNCQFDNVESGNMAGFVVPCADDGTELMIPFVFNQEVPEVENPAVLSVSGTIL